MADEKKILLTAFERALVKRMGQVLSEGRMNPDLETFTANGMVGAIKGATGVSVNHRDLGALLDRMGVAASRRDYRRTMGLLAEALPDWIEAANSAQSSQIRLPTTNISE